VDSLNLKVERNSFMGFLGPNGAGKTTTIKILTNLLKASDGHAYLNGLDVTKDPKHALSCVGAVVETPEFYPYLNPTETLMYLGSLRGMTKEDVQNRTAELLKLVKLEEVAEKRIGEFSKGMKQRLAIAQALLHQPTVIILDEPTSGLDPRGMVEVRNILKDLRKEDYTIFMSSHLLNEVQEICDYVALIDRGKLLAHGKVEELTQVSKIRRFRVELLRGPEARWLEEIAAMNGVKKVTSPLEGVLMIEFTGGEEEQAWLLRGIIEMGVISFREEGLALENLYMDLIQDSR
jgi:ABC-2 type transport system ATP-binding protein